MLRLLLESNTRRFQFSQGAVVSLVAHSLLISASVFATRDGIFKQRLDAGAFVFSAGIGLVATNWLQAFSWVIPHTYVIQALRRVLMPSGEVLPGPTTGQALIALLVFSAIAYPIALTIFGRTMDYGRKIGALSGY